MNKNNKIATSQVEGLIPEIRFPEFHNAGEWEEKELGKIASFFKGKGLAKSEMVNFGKYPCIHYGELFTTFSEVIKKTKNYTNLDNCFFSISNDVLMPTSDVTPNGLAKASCIKLDNVVLGGDILVIRTNKTKIHGEFLSRLIRHREREVLKLVTGSTVYHLYASAIEKLKLQFPLISEQQKIAACLSSLDEVITAHSQRLQLLKDHKKGLMQNLFPQEGKTIPKYRFKEFINDGEWIQTTLEENCLVKGRIGYRGYTTQDLVGQGEGALVLGGKHIQNQMIELKDPTYLSWEKYYESPEIMVEVGDIIFSQRGSLGDCAIINREIGPATINPSMVLFKNITCDASFFYYILIGERIQIEVKKNMAMGAIPMLSQKQIKEFPFLIPKNTKEQEKIASCLSSLDDLIRAQLEKLEQLKLHKKGLMQGLFPKINE